MDFKEFHVISINLQLFWFNYNIMCYFVGLVSVSTWQSSNGLTFKPSQEEIDQIAQRDSWLTDIHVAAASKLIRAIIEADGWVMRGFFHLHLETMWISRRLQKKAWFKSSTTEETTGSPPKNLPTKNCLPCWDLMILPSSSSIGNVSINTLVAI